MQHIILIILSLFYFTLSDDLIRPFVVDVPDTVLEDLSKRLENARLPPPLETDLKSWNRGSSAHHIQEMISYWKSTYDWRKQEKVINQMPQFMTTIDNVDVHFVHAKSPHPNAQPLIMVHGWPGSFFEFYKILPMLIDPPSYGGSADDAFHVVCPSLPGYAFSRIKPGGALNQRQTAALFTKLMTRLNYTRFWAQGGDWGSIVTQFISVDYPDRVIAYHTTLPSGFLPFNRGFLPSLYSILVLIAPSYMLSPLDYQSYQRVTLSYFFDLSGYFHLQATKPQTIGIALNDSPTGLASYILEKFYNWSNQTEGCFTKDELITNLMIYWVTQSITTSVNYYYEFAATFGSANNLYVTVPTGVAWFPDELGFGVKAFSEYNYNLKRWTRMESGGHFAAFEKPLELATEIFAFRRQLRDEKEATKSEM